MRAIIQNDIQKKGIRMKLLDSPHPYAFTTSVFWSLAYVLTRICAQYLNPLHISALRCTVATIVLIVVIFAAKLPKPKMKDIKWFILSGASGIFLYMICFNKGASTVTTATGNVMLAMAPVITAIAARFLFKERLCAVQWIAIVVCFAGVALLTFLSGGLTMNSGLLWLMLAVLAMSTYNLLQKYLSRTYPSLTITSFSFIIGTIGLSVFTPSAVGQLAEAPIKVYILLLVLGCCSSALAYCCWTKAFSKAKNASSVSNYMFINPFISSLMGWLIIGDPIEKSAIFGGAAIMIGLFLFNFGPGFIQKYTKRINSAGSPD